MRIKVSKKYVYIEETVIIILFLCVLSIRARSFLANYMMCMLFITFHELSHIVLASVFGYELRGINIRLTGLNAVFKGTFIGLKGIIIYLAGPISNIILALLFNNIKFVYEINIVLAVFNMFLIKPLDGLNILKLILLELENKKQAEIHLKIIQKTTEILLTILAVFMCVKFHNFSLFLLLVYIKSKTM